MTSSWKLSFIKTSTWCVWSDLFDENPVFLGEVISVAHSRQSREGEDCLAVEAADGGGDRGVGHPHQPLSVI